MQQEEFEGKPRGWGLLPQLHKRSPLAAFILRSLGNAGHMRMALQKLPNSTPQNPRSMPVNHTHPGQPGEKRAIEILLQLLGRFIDSAPNQVDLHAHFVRVGAGDADMDVLLAARCGYRISLLVQPWLLSKRKRCGALIALDAHLDRP